MLHCIVCGSQYALPEFSETPASMRGRLALELSSSQVFVVLHTACSSQLCHRIHNEFIEAVNSIALREEMPKRTALGTQIGVLYRSESLLCE